MSTPEPTTTGPGPVSAAPQLPDGLTETFTSRIIDAALTTFLAPYRDAARVATVS